MIFIAGITIAILIEFLLLSKKNKSESDKFLTLWMFLIVVHLFLFYTEFSGAAFEYPFLLGVSLPLPLLQAVFLYFYVGSLTNLLPKNRSILLLHLLPAAIAYLYLISFFMLPSDEKIFVYENQGAGYEIFLSLLNYATIISGIAYVTWSLLLLRRHRRNILDKFSDVEKINLRWLQILTWGMGGIWLIVIFEEGSIFTFSGVVIFVFLIAFFGIKQVRIFASNEPAEVDAAPPKGKYAKSGLNEALSSRLYEQLITRMNSEALYRNGDLSIGDLASQLDVHPNYLSQVINEREGRNFYDFVNHYRVEEFKRLIADPKNHHLTLLSMAFDCGFNSKSAFNRYFKKNTGQTPSEYFSSVTKV
ncbi:helix-turn-helix domain-containing protein [Fulvivirgaceae bacterium BMA12]|uniref:Helix-turn-helix domain-containing protein n=1 Tax=Agaribacillus aureus TaxID=3051825 RepID=A0ABT8LFE4_9BACT|nr:helix-turn-helix domain-containing protein [Fulvivirgaceae bacterium BMA12]